MPTINSVSIIFNPNSTGNAQQQAESLQTDLGALQPGLPVELVPTKHAGHATELAYQIASTAPRGTTPLIVSASGDGGYNEVINGALRAQNEGAAPLCAVLPSGNANDHARTMQDKPLTELIKRNQPVQLDVLKVSWQAPGGKQENRYAHSYAGLGLTPTVAVELNKHSLNALREAWIVTRTFWNLQPVILRLQDKTVKVDSVVCSIIPEMAKVLTLSQAAEADDGAFEVTTLTHRSKHQLLWQLVKSIAGKSAAQTRQKSYACTVLRAAPLQVDGEVLELTADTKLEIAICPGLLHTLV